MGQIPLELRRSAALLAGVGAIVVLVLLLWARRTWQGGLPDLTTSLRGYLLLLLPLAVAAGAWQGGRERRACVEDLLVTTPRPPWQRQLPPVAAVATAVVTAVAAVLLGITAVHGTGDWLHQFWPVAVTGVGLLALAACVAVGVGLGRVTRSNLVAPVVMVGSLFVLVTAYGRWQSQWLTLLNPVLQTRQNRGVLLADTQQVRTAVTAGQTVWLVGLLVAGLVLAGAATTKSRLLAVPTLLVSVLIASPFLAGSAGGKAYGVDAAANAPFCAPGRPAVCGAVAHRTAVLRAASPARDVLAALRQLPTAPTRAVETSQFPGGSAVPNDVLPLSPFAITVPGVRAASIRHGLAWGLSVPDRCSSPTAALAQRVYEARVFTGAWLLHEPDTSGYGSEPVLDRALRRFYELPRPEQVRRMTIAQTAMTACTPDPLAGLLAGLTS